MEKYALMFGKLRQKIKYWVVSSIYENYILFILFNIDFLPNSHLILQINILFDSILKSTFVDSSFKCNSIIWFFML